MDHEFEFRHLSREPDGSYRVMFIYRDGMSAEEFKVILENFVALYQIDTSAACEMIKIRVFDGEPFPSEQAALGTYYDLFEHDSIPNHSNR